MDIRAAFELPVYIWVMREALDGTYPAGFGQLRFTVVRPTEGPPIDELPTTGPPAIEGIESHAELSSDDVEWAQEYGAFIPESLKPATALLRIGITEVDGPPTTTCRGSPPSTSWPSASRRGSTTSAHGSRSSARTSTPTTASTTPTRSALA